VFDDKIMVLYYLHVHVTCLTILMEKGGEKKMLALIPCVGPLLALAVLIGATPVEFARDAIRPMVGLIAPFVAFTPTGLATLCFAF